MVCYGTIADIIICYNINTHIIMKTQKLHEVQVWFDSLLQSWAVIFYDDNGHQIGTFHDLSDKYETQRFHYKKDAVEYAHSYHKQANITFYKRNGDEDYTLPKVTKEQLFKRWLHECPVDFKIHNEVASNDVTTMQITFSH